MCFLVPLSLAVWLLINKLQTVNVDTTGFIHTVTNLAAWLHTKTAVYKRQDTEKLINIILRSYTGLFTDYSYMNEDSLVIRSGVTRQRIYEILLALTRRHIIHYIPRKKTPYIIYTRERQEKKDVYKRQGIPFLI